MTSWRKYLHWEYWPIWLANLPLAFFWLWFALRARRLFFFTAVNPTIETGGFFGESKIGILRQIPAEYLPKTVFLPADTDAAEALRQLEVAGIGFPAVLKPDVGERGTLVTIVYSAADFEQAFRQHRINWLVQEFVDEPLEGSILFHRKPGTEEVRITSFCVKSFLQVTGDGNSSIEVLMKRDLRASLQLDRFRSENPQLLHQIPPKGETIVLEPVGNHCRGTTFLSGNRHIDGQLTEMVAGIARRMPDIHYGRFDIRYRNLEGLRKGEHFSILELNGIAGEPAHIYDPALSIFRKYAELFRHWQIIYSLYRQQARRGIRPDSFRDFWSEFIRYRNYQRKIRTVGTQNENPHF